MPKRTDIQTILVIGAGPIVIGQAAEFDYSGTQAVKALKREGYRVVLINSNPATIMTDPELADATYVEPITPEIIELIIQQEKPDALLPTVGGQTGLNMAVQLAERGILEKYGVQLIGASLRAMQLAEDRLLFKEAMLANGLEVPQGGLATSLEEAIAVAEEIGHYPILIRPSFTLGGSGAATVYNREEFIEKAEFGLKQSPVGSVLVEESVLGWKEYELEVMRDKHDNFVVVCSIENLDPMGVHTGDSITVAPAMTLTDREYQRLRDHARTVMEVIGVETGGSNVQFAIDPATGRVIVIEMNPRVSRSSALASKATGFAIAKIAALLAVGYTLDELKNDITGTCAAFEPSIDYVVTKIPRWAFEKFSGVDPTLGPQMKSVGEAMAIGRTFKESLLKALQSLELSRTPYPSDGYSVWDGTLESLAIPRAERLWAVWEALRAGHTAAEVHATSFIDPWFLAQMQDIVALETQIMAYSSLDDLPRALLRRAKRAGFGDGHIAWLLSQSGERRVESGENNEERKETEGTEGNDKERQGTSFVSSPAALAQGGAERETPVPERVWNTEITASDVRAKRLALGITATFQMVDSCGAEFEATTPYLYSSYESESEAAPSDRNKVIILGGGPNRIGQGIEFDYCCVHAAMAFRDLGIETIIVNCNPETVSTDYDTSDRLYFEPLTLEHVLNIVEREQSNGHLIGVVVQFGGQTPLNLTRQLEAAGVPIIGTSPDAIDLAEDRERFGALLADLDIPSPSWGIARELRDARTVARKVGYPVMVRPSYVLGGRAMGIVYDEAQLASFVSEAQRAAPGQAILIDHYLEDAFEVDVDAVADGYMVVIGGIMQHIEEAGVHSGDSATVLPPYKISEYHLSHIRDYTEELGLALGVKGLMNVQYAIKDDVVYVLEVNPRASRTVPYVSKATAVPLAKVAARVMAGKSLDRQGVTDEPDVSGFFVKEAVLPFKKFLGVDAVLSPEMRSTGEVMGHASRFGHAFAKAQMAAGDTLPSEGRVFVSVNDFDKSTAMKIARDLYRMGFEIVATSGTAQFFNSAGVPCTSVQKVSEGSPHILDSIKAGDIALIINTPLGAVAQADGVQIRTNAIRYGVPLLTTLSAAQAAVNGIRTLKEKALEVRSLQKHHSH